nr:uncharacterized protein LOC129453194 isoform X2 [Misgurnus anguillicaudatus]
MEGDSVTLYTDIFKQKDDMVVWSYGPENTFVGRINGKAGSIMLSENEKFKDRVKLNDQTGDLTITDVTPEHTGDYTCKISRNNKVSYKKINVMVNDEVKSVSVINGIPVTLHTDIVKQKDDMVVWSYGPENTFVGRINGKAGSIMLSENEKFKDRVKLNDQTGDLTITDIRSTDSGVYTCKISRNNKVSYKKFNVRVNGVSMDEVKSVVEGDSVTLHTNITEIQTDDRIMWYYGTENTLVARINGNAGSIMLSDDGRFRDRVKLNHQNGDLIITNIRTTDYGFYNLKIRSDNKIAYKKFNITVTAYQPVTKIFIRDQAHLNIDDVCQTCSELGRNGTSYVTGLTTG